jgi:hypothetical protein
MQSSSDGRSTAVRSLAERVGRPVFRLGLGALWAYACSVIPFGRIIPGIGKVGVALVFAAGLAAIIALPRLALAGRRLSRSRMLDLGVMATLVVVLLVAADFALTVRDNWAVATSQRQISAEAREHDSAIWHGELYPRLYTPPGESFSLFKPNLRVSGETYGERYVASMMKSPTLVKSVLERRRLSYSIGPDGLRELEPLSASRIFVLGDSFAFGFATDEGLIWPDLLGAALGAPIYNLGVSATGPRQHVDLLRYMFKTHGDDMRPQRVLWMLFEGNDLENSYQRRATLGESRGFGDLVQGTIVEPLLDQTFMEMRELSREKSFAVTIVIAPSDARLYGRAFDGFPQLSDQPHFVNYLEELAGETGFDVINLLPLLEPHAAEEMLYYRDDHHWNVRGNQLAAELIRERLTPH